jgi:hypothetical protein
MLRMCEMIAKILLLQIKIALSLPQNTPLCPPPALEFFAGFLLPMWRRLAAKCEVAALAGGKSPHPPSVCVGGRTCHV